MKEPPLDPPRQVSCWDCEYEALLKDGLSPDEAESTLYAWLEDDPGCLKLCREHMEEARYEAMED